MSSESVPERGVRLLRAEYERQVVLLNDEHHELVDILEADIERLHFEDWELGEVAERVLAIVNYQRGLGI